MSKIGKINIPIPDKVKVLLSGNIVNIEGPLGKQAIKLDLEMFELNINEGKDLSIKPKKLDDTSKRLWGMNRSLLNNAIVGASSGYEKILELTGVGFRATLKISGSNKQQVGMVASQIKSIRPPEPYKGKGIKEKGQYILRKEGKKK